MTAPAFALDRTALAELARAFDLTLVLRFGSRVTGHTRPDSDTDLGVWRVAGSLPWKQYSELYRRLADLLPPGQGELDLVDLQHVPGLLKHIACEQGELLYEAAPGAFARFRVLAWNLYQDERLSIRRHDSEAIRNALRSFAK
jgi:predicted nucleotidyltransferase